MEPVCVGLPPQPSGQLQAKALWLKLPASHCRAWGPREPWTTLSLQPYPLHQGPRWEHMFTIFSRLGVSKGRHTGGGGLGKPVEFLMGFPYNYNGGTWLRAGQGLAKPSPHPPSFLGWE